MNRLPDTLREELDRLAALARLRPVQAVLDRDNVIPFPKAPPDRPCPAPPRFNRSAITGELPWWARD